MLHTDGGARGNPGPAGIGAVLTTPSGRVIAELGRGIGTTTNNVAEYTALIEGLRMALDQGVTDIEVFMDSELVVSQLSGRWKIKNERLRHLAVEARAVLSRFRSVRLEHVRRAHNARADELANRGMNEAEAGPAGSDGDRGQGSLL